MEKYIEPYNNIPQDVKVVIPFHEYSFMKQKIKELENDLKKERKIKEIGEFVKPYEEEKNIVELLFTDRDSHCMRYTGTERKLLESFVERINSLVQENFSLREKLEKKWWRR